MKKAGLKIGVVGLGRLGSLYAEYLAYQIPKASVIAVADEDGARADKVGQLIGVENIFTDYRDMLEIKELDAIVITTPTSTHKEIVEESANKGKIIFCEKPLSISLEETQQMKRAVDKNGVFFHMGFMRRFDPGYAAAKKRILNGEIGDPIVFKASSRDPERPSLEFADPVKSGGLFLDLGIHDFDLARWFMGDVSEVYSIGNILAYPEMESINDIDNAMVNIMFESGTIGTVDMSRSGIYGYDIRTEILGTKGTIQIGYLRETPIIILKKEAVMHDTVPNFMERFELAYINQLRNFVERAYNGAEPSVTILDGELGLVVGHAAAKSFDCKEPVVIDNESLTFGPKSVFENNKMVR
ncbi:Gfo/Idh/MocA family oxidoreductase [Aliifodinibius sp. S!AR15-10]|uniref:Gfo/Idh/MocA family protein n=1 Tax=Aliifodinibius sp. S!AR15-10 TaxID=2950437 RepID=UPI002860427E|nr:Gfo/Idh/MocA family oxidoreductase [Aliifodinibius sp. S!AR15-10]MDR8391724.1 Gfo/Idh/MocA family oxidoreductase [Aliifodinibius sp. S!AR15-10]